MIDVTHNYDDWRPFGFAALAGSKNTFEFFF
jgi:hypothetical protein